MLRRKSVLRRNFTVASLELFEEFMHLQATTKISECHCLVTIALILISFIISLGTGLPNTTDQ